MSFLGKNSLLHLLENSDIVKPFYKESIKNGSYELCLGQEVFQTDAKPRAVKHLKSDEEIYIAPGQFALLLTEESVKIPNDKIAFISIKAGVKFKGLVNVSGFHVDPGYEGKLLFSVYNAGPSIIVLKRGERYFPIWFAELNEEQTYIGNHAKQISIPVDPIAALSQGDLASPSALLEKIKEDYNTLNLKITGVDDAQHKRMDLFEKDQKAIDYLVKTALGIIIAIILKFVLDWYVFNQGLTKGAEIKEREYRADSSINELLLKKKELLLEIDSLNRIEKK